MADIKISALAELTTPATGDYLPIVDSSAVVTKRLNFSSLRMAASVKDYGATGNGSTDDTAAIQACITANKIVVFPVGVYRITSTVTVPTDHCLLGYSHGASNRGSKILVDGDFTCLDCTSTTRVSIEGLHFYKLAATTCTHYCIDMTGGFMNSVRFCAFGDTGDGGCPPGIYATGSVHWFMDNRFLRINDAGGVNDWDPHWVAIYLQGSNMCHIGNGQHERYADIVLNDCNGVHIDNVHGEYVHIRFINSRDCALENSDFTTSSVFLDNKSCGNKLRQISGVMNNLYCNGAENTLENVTFDNVGPIRQPIAITHQTSPVKPVTYTTTAHPDPTYAYSYNGKPGDVYLFSVTVEPSTSINDAYQTDTIRFIDPDTATVLHDSYTDGGCTISLWDSIGTTGYRSDYVERFTYWHALAMPASGKIAVRSQSGYFKCNVWCSKALNSDPLATTLAQWQNYTDTPVTADGGRNVLSTTTVAKPDRITYTPSGSSWSVDHAMPPFTPATAYLYVLRGEWTDDQVMQLWNNDSGGYRVRSYYTTGSGQHMTQFTGTNEKMLFAYVPPQLDFGGHHIAFGFNVGTDLTPFKLTWCMVVPMDSTCPVYPRSFTAADTTPSVKGTDICYCANAAPTTITDFDDGQDGQRLTIIFADSNTTVSDAGNLKLSAAFSSAADATLSLVRVGGVWYETGRSAN